MKNHEGRTNITPGISIREIDTTSEASDSTHELQVLVDLINLANAVDKTDHATSMEQLQASLAPLSIKPLDKIYLAEYDKQLVGFVRMRLWTEEVADRFTCRGVIHPEYRRLGIGGKLVLHALQEARVLKHRAPAHFNLSARADTPGIPELAQSLNLRPVRHFLKMGMPLHAELAPIPSIPQVRFRPFVTGKDETGFVEVINDAFRTHWGFVAINTNDLQVLQDQEDFEPENTIVAEVDGKLVGVCGGLTHTTQILRHYQEWAIVEDLAVRQNWQQRGIGKALLLACLHHVFQAGKKGAYLWVDTENTHRALTFYKSVGFTEVVRYTNFATEI